MQCPPPRPPWPWKADTLLLPAPWGGMGSDGVSWKPPFTQVQPHQLPMVLLTPLYSQGDGEREVCGALLLLEPQPASSPCLGGMSAALLLPVFPPLHKDPIIPTFLLPHLK